VRIDGRLRDCFLVRRGVATHIRSQGLIAMRNGGATIGMIALGSEDPERFYAGMGTIYLERLGEMAAAALARVLA
jgi:uncharacterized protein YigA (DUF484 family)